MKTKRLGNTDLDLSVIGLGTWAIGGDWFMGWGPQEEDDSITAIREAIDCGVNWIDTAPAYGFGRAEEVVGRALKGLKRKPLIATKCGILNDGSGQVENSLRQKSIEKEVELSLSRLQVEVIDLYQIHWPKPVEQIEEGFYTLTRLKERGLIRWAGVSNFSVEQLESISAIGTPSSLQPPYNILERGIESEILPWCKRSRTGVLAYSPMECGLLSGKFSQEWVDSLPPTDWRKARWGRLRRFNYFEEPELSGLVDFTSALTRIAAERDRPLAQLAINWVLRHSAVTSAIVGARKGGQILETARAAQWDLSAEEIAEIEESYQKYQDAMGRGAE
jgi:aryl-alcohol dehydrogenase-like predicted oxidoreductase